MVFRSMDLRSGAKSFLILLLSLGTNKVHADIPTGEIAVSYIPTSPSSYRSASTSTPVVVNGKEVITLYATQASFGSYPPQQKKAKKIENYPFTLKPVFSPDVDPLLCNTDEYMSYIDPNQIPHYDSSVVMLIPRGTCTFERKALNAQLRYNVGAVIIYGDLFSRYGYNETTDQLVYPVDKNDYDCSYGEGAVNYNELIFNPTYVPMNDALVNYKCENGEGDKQCASHKCLITGPPDASGSSQVCCAWDLHIWLYADNTIPANTTDTTVVIPSMYITMDQFDELNDIIANNQDVELSMYSRNRSDTNLSGVLIWALGVFTAALASYLSADEIRKKTKRVDAQSLVQRVEPTINDQLVDQIRNHQNTGRLRSRSPRSNNMNATHNQTILVSSDLDEVEVSNNSEGGDEDSVEITLMHAVFFLVWSSMSLMILFYFKIYNVVKVMYAFGCAGALTQVMIYPLFRYLSAGRFEADKIFFSTSFLEIGGLSYLDFASTLTGYTIGFVWLIIAFTVRHPEEITFFWVVQDLMGMSICVVFLSILKVNTLKIASVLLISAFFYDIFFVFITPYIFSGKSIMVTVATSGGPPTADPLWCEKYPSDKDCQGGQPLPMLLTIPRFADYLGGASLLGLGDIVLPGLLLSFASRLDASKNLVASLREGRRGADNRRGFFKSYFGPVVIAYAIGLMMANMAVVLMQMGQPALLYLVPMCLGSLFYIGRKNGEISELWNGPKVLKTAERLVKDSELHSDRGQESEDNISLT